jgi:hypothetical protein
MYTVRNLKDITSYIIPHFEKYKLITQKRADYEIFKKILTILSSVRGLDIDNFYKILNLKVNHNKGINEEIKNTFPNIIGIPRMDVPLASIPNPQ